VAQIQDLPQTVQHLTVVVDTVDNRKIILY
jgi:hypothetical protein